MEIMQEIARTIDLYKGSDDEYIRGRIDALKEIFNSLRSERNDTMNRVDDLMRAYSEMAIKQEGKSSRSTEDKWYSMGVVCGLYMSKSLVDECIGYDENKVSMNNEY